MIDAGSWCRNRRRRLADMRLLPAIVIFTHSMTFGWCYRRFRICFWWDARTRAASTSRRRRRSWLRLECCLQHFSGPGPRLLAPRAAVGSPSAAAPSPAAAPPDSHTACCTTRASSAAARCCARSSGSSSRRRPWFVGVESCRRWLPTSGTHWRCLKGENFEWWWPEIKLHSPSLAVCSLLMLSLVQAIFVVSRSMACRLFVRWWRLDGVDWRCGGNCLL